MKPSPRRPRQTKLTAPQTFFLASHPKMNSPKKIGIHMTRKRPRGTLLKNATLAHCRKGKEERELAVCPRLDRAYPQATPQSCRSHEKAHSRPAIHQQIVLPPGEHQHHTSRATHARISERHQTRFPRIRSGNRNTLHATKLPAPGYIFVPATTSNDRT